MISSIQLQPTAFSLAAVLCWGVSDFTGGYASKKSDAFLVTTLAHAAGFTLMLTLALTTHAPFPSRPSVLWAVAAGALGGSALAVFYRALATGRMGITAPVAAVLGAGIPALVGMGMQGLPGTLPLAGFALAGVGIWLISRQDGVDGASEGLGLAVLSGLGFAGFFLCISRTANSAAFWSTSCSRFASLVAVGAMVLLRRGKHQVQSHDALLGVLAGILDSTGTLLFIRANQTGRLDAAVMLTSLYPAITVLLARMILKEQFTRWRTVGVLAALLAVPMIAMQ